MDGSAPEGYRPNVGIVLVNREGRIFAGRRRDTPGAWQMPQGGIDPGEAPEAAARRELLEETGTDRARLVAMTEGWLCYDFPPEIGQRMGHRGQAQKWALMRFDGEDGDIDVAAEAKPEFDAWRWLDPDDLLGQIVPFKRAVYERVLRAFAARIGEVREREEGE